MLWYQLKDQFHCDTAKTSFMIQLCETSASVLTFALDMMSQLPIIWYYRQAGTVLNVLGVNSCLHFLYKKPTVVITPASVQCH